MFFVVANALFDAGIAAWDAKCAFDSERPITDVRYLMSCVVGRSIPKTPMRGNRRTDFQTCYSDAWKFSRYTPRDTAKKRTHMSNAKTPTFPPLSADRHNLVTVLYVEDNAANLELVDALLKRRGNVTLVSATHAPAGLSLAISLQPTIILMDIQLSGMNGDEALQRLREDAATSHIPVIALSSNAYPSQIEKGLKAGFFRYLTKPFTILEFTDAVDAALDLAAKIKLRCPTS